MAPSNKPKKQAKAKTTAFPLANTSPLDSGSLPFRRHFVTSISDARCVSPLHRNRRIRQYQVIPRNRRFHLRRRKSQTFMGARFQGRTYGRTSVIWEDCGEIK